MTVVRPTDHIDAVGREARAFAAAVRADRHRPVAACPDWDVAALAVHTGFIFRWAAEIVRTRATEPVKATWTLGVDDPALADWLVEGADEVVGVLGAAHPDTPVWTMGPPPTARFWSRRQALETLVHRWDAEHAALGQAQPLDAELAADGIGEIIDVWVPRLHRRSAITGAGESYHFHRTDGPGEWLVRFGPEGPEAWLGHEKADVALRGSAEDLLLVLWRRRPPDTVDVFGEPAALARWFDLVPAI